jgi:DNA-binding MarR family transcriptional regulator
MPKAITKRDRSPLYRLIAAGQLAHRAMLAPALDRGLAAGDETLLYLLATMQSPTAAELAGLTGLSAEALKARLGGLIDRELVVLRATGPDMLPNLRLTARGARLEALLADRWIDLEGALLGELGPRQRKTLGKRLARIINLLEA